MMQTLARAHMAGSRALSPSMLTSSLAKRGLAAAAIDKEALDVVLITGPPGGGKGTLSKRLKKEFNFSHLSSGDILRSHMEEHTPLGEKAKAYVEAGDLVPDELMVDLIMHEVFEQSGRVLLDGFPRTLPQAKALEDKIEIDFVLNLEVPQEEIVERISDRWIHQHSGRMYSYAFNPPKEEGKDDETGEPLTRRADDEPDKVRHRLDMYMEVTYPLLAHYEEKGILYSFSGENHPELVRQNRRSDAIYTDLKALVQSKLEG
ncbi:Adenylate kinase [Hondaea fermentalgiana]|uniref:Adenylate kinase n=1 Tax=Hondaea fermentalgiana TaxID=2315210 RepID=A0A2R5G5V4_9STRA|nr:Adenylate kinase [Hondaea fermentalgiana]|eukprot:GBG26370.1 Adenylate kinase [Hondaea fermentalgiana]